MWGAGRMEGKARLFSLHRKKEGRKSNLWYLLVLQVESRLAVKQALLQIHCCCGAAQPLQSNSESFCFVLALRMQRFCFLRAVYSALGDGSLLSGRKLYFAG